MGCQSTIQAELVNGQSPSEAIEVADRTDESAPVAAGWQERSHNPFKRRSDLIKAVLSIGDQAVFSGTSFLSAVIIGRVCTADDLGLYYLTLTIAFIAIGIQDSLISSPFAIFSNTRRGRDLEEFTGSAWVHYLFLASLYVVLLAIGATVTQLLGGASFLPGLKILLFVLPLLLLREAIRRFAFARLKLNVAIAVDVTVSAVQLSGLLLLVSMGRMSILGIFGVMGAACAVASVGWWIFRPQAARIVPGRIWSDWTHSWHFASWSLYSYVVGSTIPFVMPWIVASLVSPAAAGLFGAVSTLVGMTNVLVLGANNFLTPKGAASFADGGAAGLRRVLVAAAMLLLLLIGTFLLAILLTGDRLALLVFKKEEFRGCGPLMATLAANVLIGSLGMIAVTGLWVLGKQRINFAMDVCVFGVTMLAAALLVVPYGALGAALASLTGAAVGTTLRAVMLHQALNSCVAVPGGDLMTPSV